MTRIWRIFTDFFICFYPSYPCHPCSIIHRTTHIILEEQSNKKEPNEINSNGSFEISGRCCFV